MSTSPASRTPLVPMRTLQHGGIDQLSRRSADEEQWRRHSRRARPDGDRRSRLRFRAWRQPARLRSLIDLVVFGRALRRLAEKLTPTATGGPAKGFADMALGRLDHYRYASGGSRPQNCARACSTSCRAIARCSAPARPARRPEPDPQGPWRHRRGRDHRPLAGLEFRPDRNARIRQSIAQAVVTMNSAANRTESRGAHAREVFPSATTRTG